MADETLAFARAVVGTLHQFVKDGVLTVVDPEAKPTDQKEVEILFDAAAKAAAASRVTETV